MDGLDVLWSPALRCYGICVVGVPLNHHEEVHAARGKGA